MFGYYQYSRGHKSIDKIKADYSYTAEQFLEIYKRDEQKADELYLEKVIEINGVVKELNAEDGVVAIVSLATGSLFESIQCELATPLGNNNIKLGEHVKIKGYCTGKLMDIVLNRCVLVQ